MCTGTHPFIPALHTARLELICVLFDQRVENVLYYQGTGSWDITSLTDLANDAITRWTDDLAPQIAGAVQLVLVKATDVETEEGVGVEFEPTDPTYGGGSGVSMPGGVTLATKFSGGFTGRSRRGRAFNIGIPATEVTGNTVSDVFAGGYSSNWSNFDTHLVAGTNAPVHVIASYCHDGEWREDAVLTPVTSYSTNDDLDSQRRRLNGRGL